MGLTSTGILCGLSFWLCWAALAAAQPAGDAGLGVTGPLSVEQCVQIALERSDLIGQAEGREDVARGGYWAAYSGILPSVTADGGWQKARQAVAGLLTDEGDATWGGVTVRGSLINVPAWRTLGAQGRAYAAAREDLRDAQGAIEVAAREQFYASVASLKLAEVEERALALAKEQLRRSETLFRLGSVARSDVLQAQVSLAEAELVAIQRRNAVAIEHGRLAVVMGLDPRTELEVDSSLVVPESDPQGDLDSWVAQALGRRPDVAAAQARLRAAELAQSAARWLRLPTLGAQASWAQTKRAGDQEALSYLTGEWETSPYDYTSEDWSVAVAANLNLFTGLQTEGEIERTKGQVLESRELLERLEKDAALEVRNSDVAIRDARESLNVARTSVSLAEESLRLQQALYESGAGTLLDWDDARLKLRRAELSRIQAEIGLLLSHARFRRALGE
jgi:outer membrane protein